MSGRMAGASKSTIDCPEHPEEHETMKRRLMGVAALLPWIPGCSLTQPRNSLDPQQRFKDIGIELVVDAVPGAELRQVIFYDDQAVRIFSSSTVAKRNRAIMPLGGERVPLTVRVVWREGAGWDAVKNVWNEGTITGDYTVPIAERIPDDVLKDIRAMGGGLRLKFRLKPDGVLFGWDVEMRPDPHRYSAEEITARNIHLPPAYRHTGGDFKGARPAYYWWDGNAFKGLPQQIPTPASPQDQAMLDRFGLMTVEGTILTIPPSPANHRRVWEKGWYIDQKTGQKVETDY
jgi:hypothetical protein